MKAAGHYPDGRPYVDDPDADYAPRPGDSTLVATALQLKVEWARVADGGDPSATTHLLHEVSERLGTAEVDARGVPVEQRHRDMWAEWDLI